MLMSPPSTEEIEAFRMFVENYLTGREKRVLYLLATAGISQKEIACEIKRDVKTVEGIISNIGRKYERHHHLDKGESRPGRIRILATIHYCKRY